MVVCVIGLGLIGGSLAIALKERGFANSVVGVDKSVEHGKEALEIGFIDEYLPLEEGVKKADLVVMAIPVDAAKTLTPTILDLLSPQQTLMDMGSTKGGISKVAEKHPNRSRFVATHPIAGTENAGPSAAFNSLYDNKITIICDKEKSDSNAVELVTKVYNTLKMKVLEMGSEEHDRHIAYVSHLSHITSFVLGQTVLEIEKDEKSIFNMAGSGFASTVRLAKSSPDMWAPIFEQNQEHLSTALGAYIDNLQSFKNKIDNGEKEDLRSLMKTVNEIRRVLSGIEKK